MNFRRVEIKFQRAALLMQALLFSFMLCYVVFSIRQIVDASSDPPVETTAVQWTKDLGVWAVCSGTPADMAGVGTGVIASPLDIFYHRDEKQGALSGVEVSPPEMMHIAKEERNCSKMNLSRVDVNVPVHALLCADVGRDAFFFMQIRDHWEYVCHFNAAGETKWFGISKLVDGWDYGFSTVEDSIFATSDVDGPWGFDLTNLCADMTYFSSQSGKVSSLLLSVVNPVVLAHHKQGMIPQLFKLFGSIGGYMTFLGMVFTFFFVKKYPDSAVFQIYEARTLVFAKIWSYMQGKGKKDKQGNGKKDKEPDVAYPAPLPLPPGLFKELETE